MRGVGTPALALAVRPDQAIGAPPPRRFKRTFLIRYEHLHGTLWHTVRQCARSGGIMFVVSADLDAGHPARRLAVQR